MFGGSKSTVVKEFTSRRQMARTVARMAERGYRIRTQSGEFSHNPFVARWNRRRVIVTFERDHSESPAASPVTD